MDLENIGELGALAPLTPCQNSVRVSPKLYSRLGDKLSDLAKLNVFASYLELLTSHFTPSSPRIPLGPDGSESAKGSKGSKGSKEPWSKMKNPGFTRARAFAARYRPGLAGSLVAGVHATGGHRLRTIHRVP